MLLWNRFALASGLLLMTGLLARCGGDAAVDARAQAQPPEVPAPVAEAPRLFDPASIRAPEDGARAAVLAQLESQPAQALAAAEAALAGAADAEDPDARDERVLLHWLAARAADAVEREDAVEAHLRAVTDHPLARWATLKRAERLRERNPAAAAELAATLTEERWAGRWRARVTEALALAAAEDWEAAVPEMRALVAETDPNVGAATVGMPLAAHLASLEDDPAAREEALHLYRRVATRAPRARVGQRAAELAEAVLATLPDDRREELAEIPLADRFHEAESLYGAMRHRDAERAFEAIARSLDRETHAMERCEAELMQGRAMLRRRQRREGAPWMVAVAERCESTDVKAWARYLAGRALTQLGQRSEARAQFASLLEEAPAHRLADDALYRSALIADDETMLEELAAVAERYPDGDMRGEALFRLAMTARAAGDHELALRWLDQLVADPDEDTEGMHGRAAYWRARTLVALERVEDAVDTYEQVVRAWPLSYYGQLALRRVTTADAARGERLVAALRQEDEQPLAFPWRAELDTPAFAAATALLEVRETELARRELESLGALSEGADPDMLWLAAAMLHEGGALPEVTHLVRRRLGSFRTTAPRGRARALWRLAYPKAFAGLIEEHAEEAEVPASFVRAIAREESSFNPGAVSWAHAYGLVQIILPTARRWGRELDVPINATTLRRPEVNLAVGTRYMAFLRARYAENPALVPAAYNAGHGAVDRWLRQRGDVELDEYVERIPYDETRRYTRRVLQTWGVYAWLDEGELPDLPESLPN